MAKQRTISKETEVEGVGLHTANPARIRFKPAGENHGIVFVRKDLEGSPSIGVLPENVLFNLSFFRRTSLGNNGVEIHTVEHLMAALCGLEIDNLIIEIDNIEVPGLDGSAKDFVDALLKAGIYEQAEERHCFSLREAVFVEEEGASIVAIPSNDFKISYTLSYPGIPALETGYLEYLISSNTFSDSFAGARTFCLEEEAGDLQGKGLGKGASYRNTLVVGKRGVVKNKLRFPDEFVRHKILDLMGDFYLLGTSLKAHIIAIRSGHFLNLKLLKKIYQQKLRASRSAIKLNYTPAEGKQLDTEAVMRVLPHRPPFLFVDKIIDLEEGKRCVGIKNLTINDYFFKGHFPQRPVMPGVLVIEAMAQVGGVMMLSLAQNRGKLAYFMAANNVKFRKPVLPGDQLVLEVKAVRIKAKTGHVHAEALVEDKLVAEADLMFALS
ncbi:MAG: UDP-3-O-[3-hydroxymyristoyl] N-acetylglucosamine deacetylase [Candidatus Omnitrophica bacterium]|nr:UDP-3-O-[3-hydroxymyristoyl] N-acetylglucosamine deacetylase [Candidatus Omnitrophota bacterium]